MSHVGPNFHCYRLAAVSKPGAHEGACGGCAYWRAHGAVTPRPRAPECPHPRWYAAAVHGRNARAHNETGIELRGPSELAGAHEWSASRTVISRLHHAPPRRGQWRQWPRAPSTRRRSRTNASSLSAFVSRSARLPHAPNARQCSARGSSSSTRDTARSYSSSCTEPFRPRSNAGNSSSGAASALRGEATRPR